MLRRIAVVLFALAVVVTVSGTGAYSATSADRGLTVDVVDDDEAYVGHDPGEIYAVNTTNQTTTETLVTVTNRFSSPVELTDVEVHSHPGLMIEVLDESGQIESGESMDINAAVLHCDEEAMSMDVGVSVTVDGDDVAATLDGDTETRTANVSCSP
ncbi:hypothetical protein [Halobacteriaceae bacterium SHR40]|uniref:hypothetical protein n=1 Tax=Halovenus amylolytica TaxID=2500550 RepID=UPI000FE3B8DB